MSNKRSKYKAQGYRSGYEAGFQVNVDYVKALKAKLERANEVIEQLKEAEGARALQGQFQRIAINIYLNSAMDYAELQAKERFKQFACQENVILIGPMWHNEPYCDRFHAGTREQATVVTFFQYAFVVKDPRLKMNRYELNKYSSFDNMIMIAPQYDLKSMELLDTVDTELPCRHNSRKKRRCR